MNMNLYWGDIHSHCGISYGYGGLENALAAARSQLDFCSIVGHATWHDMPARTKRLEYTLDFHERGFRKLAESWDKVCQTIEAANHPHQLVTFHGYETHSFKYGDYHLLSTSADLPIVETGSPVDLVTRLAPRSVIAVPHHIAYVKGYRGINWQAFSSEISPVVEVYSQHGSAMNDQGPYPYLHAMGPRDSRNTVRGGMRLGYRFGFVASTDNHAGYPGSYGDGRMAVYAAEKTRQAIWDGILARRTYAVTGDRIVARFQVNGAEIGSEIEGHGPQQVELELSAWDALDKIIVYKNLTPWKVVCGESIATPLALQQHLKIRIEMGWGEAIEGFSWHGDLSISDGTLTSVETCFRGRALLTPPSDMTDDPNINAMQNRIVQQTTTGLEWECVSFKNTSTRHPQTAAIILEIEGDRQTVLDIHLNGKRVTVSVGELLTGSQGAHLGGYKSEAFLVHRAIPDTQYRFREQWNDNSREAACDIYDVEIRQTNGQCAWLSPVFVLS